MTHALDKGRSRVEGFLKQLGVTKLVVIDDEALSVSDSVLRECPPSSLSREAHSASKSNAGYENWLDKQLDDADPRRRREWYLDALEEVPHTASSALDRLQYVFREHLTLLTPYEWNELGEEKVEKATDSAMVLFDLHLGEFQSDGRELLSDFQERFKEPVAGLLTSAVEGDEQELDQSGWGAAGPSIVISKKVFEADASPTDFVAALRTVSLSPYLKKLREVAIDISNDAHAAAMEEFGDFEPQVFEAFVAASRKEGDFEMDTVLRVLMVNYRDQWIRALQEATKDGTNRLGQLLSILDFVRPRVDEPPSNERSEKIVQQIMEKERYLHGVAVNTYGLPLANGDLFEFDNRQWILLEQPCDLMLRDNENTRNDVKNATLYELRDGPADKKSADWTMPPSFSEFGNKTRHIRFRSRTVVPFDILELSVFDRDGECVWLLDEPENEIVPLTPSLASRWQEIRSSMEALRAAIDGSEGATSALLLKADVQGEVRVDEFRWPISRIGRLSPIWATAALGYLANALGRPVSRPVEKCTILAGLKVHHSA